MHGSSCSPAVWTTVQYMPLNSKMWLTIFYWITNGAAVFSKEKAWFSTCNRMKLFCRWSWIEYCCESTSRNKILTTNLHVIIKDTFAQKLCFLWKSMIFCTRKGMKLFCRHSLTEYYFEYAAMKSNKVNSYLIYVKCIWYTQM